MVALAVMMIPVVSAQDASDEDVTYILELAWSPSGDKIAAVGVYPGTIRDDGMIPDDVYGYIHVVDVFTGQTIFTSQPPSAFTSAAWSPDGTKIALGSFDGTVWIVDALTGERIINLFGHQSTVTGVDWSSDGTKIVSSGNWDELVILWDAVNYTLISQWLTNAHPNAITFGTDDQTIIVGTEGGLYHFPLETEPFSLIPLNKRLIREWILNLTLSLDGRYIAIGTIAHTNSQGLRDTASIVIYDLTTQAITQQIDSPLGSIVGIEWNIDNRYLATLTEDSRLALWNVQTGQLTARYPTEGVERYYKGGITYSPYGGRLVYGQTVDPDSGTAPFQIIVPAPSLDRLAATAALCVRDGDARAESLIDSVPTVLDDLPAFVAQVEALPDGAIPSACKADLLAVASALGE
ncbi:MAG: hypothetical protein MUF38_00390 [Anaerolineae bacterium]|jgi:dipeptidyl aminopeptidase/acylaminoacyl peptidase|nr:hypothetical protein [Anaerolineae bacterium]